MWGRLIDISVILLMALGLVAQRLGALTGTCTQGGVGPFMTGVTLSGPILALASIYLVFMWRKPQFRREQTGVAAIAALSLIAFIVNFDVWQPTLVHGGSACGPDYDYTVDAWALNQLTIGFAYGVWPLLLAATSVALLLNRRNPS